MSEARWSAVDAYFETHWIEQDEALTAALRESAAAGLPDHHVSPGQGMLLHLLAKLCGAQRVLEIGTLAGISTIWLARALGDGGRIVTLEREEAHAAVARANLARAGIDGRVELRVGEALASLRALADEGAAPFDLVFIDADKPQNPDYLTASLRLVRTGSLIIADNVVRGGAVAEAENADPRVQGVRRFVEQVAAEPRLEATAVPTVGQKGFDGFALIRVTDTPA